MKRTEQQSINTLCERNFEIALHEYRTEHPKGKRLRSCQAWVYETTGYYLLKSYNTFIACMYKDTEEVYDVLRTVYGYTATSSQHIAKFDSLKCYGGYKTSYNNRRYTARPL